MNYAPIQNKYYKWYLSICQAKQLLKRVKTKGSGFSDHHIIPESFFFERKRKGPKGWLEGNPDDPCNIVRLKQKEHMLAHKLLTKCYNGEAKKKCIYAYQRMAVGNKTSRHYAVAMKLWEENNIAEKNPAWNGGKITLICEMCEKEYKIKPSIKTKGSKFCSKLCGDNYQRRHRQIRICKECNNEFGLNICPSSSQEFCSRRCADENQKRFRTLSKCIECGKYFGENLSPSRLKKRLCCSKSCANKHRI